MSAAKEEKKMGSVRERENRGSGKEGEGGGERNAIDLVSMSSQDIGAELCRAVGIFWGIFFWGGG